MSSTGRSEQTKLFNLLHSTTKEAKRHWLSSHESRYGVAAFEAVPEKAAHPTSGNMLVFGIERHGRGYYHIETKEAHKILIKATQQRISKCNSKLTDGCGCSTVSQRKIDKYLNEKRALEEFHNKLQERLREENVPEKNISVEELKRFGPLPDAYKHFSHKQRVQMNGLPGW